MNHFLNAMKNFKSPSKYSKNFCLSVGITGEISVLYQLPLHFVLVSLYLRLYLTLFCLCSFAIATELPHRWCQKV